jgi:hypothetical protein
MKITAVSTDCYSVAVKLPLLDEPSVQTVVIARADTDRELVATALREGPPVGHDPVASVTVCDLDGRVISRFGGHDPVLPGNLIAPHGIWVDSRGDLYVGEVVKRSGAIEYFAPLTCHAFQEFRRAG